MMKTTLFCLGVSLLLFSDWPLSFCAATETRSRLCRLVAHTKKNKKTRSAVIFHLDLIRWRAIWRRLFLEWKKKNSSRRAEPSGGVRLPNQGLFFSFFFWRKMQKRFFRQQQQNGRLRSASVRLFIWKSRAPRNRRPRPKEERTRHRQECSSFVS